MKVDNLIYNIRETQVMVGSDLAKLFHVETKFFNQAVKRNINRFHNHFRFQLTIDEYNRLRSQIVTSKVLDLRSQIETLENDGENIPFDEVEEKELITNLLMKL